MLQHGLLYIETVVLSEVSQSLWVLDCFLGQFEFYFFDLRQSIKPQGSQ